MALRMRCFPCSRLTAGIVMAAMLAGLSCSLWKPEIESLNRYTIESMQVIFYYRDLAGAERFYGSILGLPVAQRGEGFVTLRVGEALLTLSDYSGTGHDPGEPKTVALALVTEQLEEWWDYARERELNVKYPLNLAEGRPHHAFVAVDPEGYLLEFERFNDHPENEQLMPVLESSPTVLCGHPEKGALSSGRGFKGMVVWLYYRDLDEAYSYYRTLLGQEMIVDQGWTKIFQAAPGSYIGVVDESRGMHRYTDTQAVDLVFELKDFTGWKQGLARKKMSPYGDFRVALDEASGNFAGLGTDPGGVNVIIKPWIEKQ